MAHPHTELAFRALQRKIERLQNDLDEANATIVKLRNADHMCAYCQEPAEYSETGVLEIDYVTAEIIDAEIIE